MAEEMKDGGSAFPIVETDPILGTRCTPGMTLRDYLAAHAPPAPPGWVGDEPKSMEWLHRPDNVIASMIEWRWHYADAMLAERNKQ